MGKIGDQVAAVELVPVESAAAKEVTKKVEATATKKSDGRAA